MKINQNNYEQYFLDHAEGNLSQEMERELMLFLEANPDLKPILDAYDPSPIQKAEIHNDFLKKKLKKKPQATHHINEGNIDEWMIGHVEGLLKDDEEKEREEFIALNPAYGYDQKLYRLTRLSPDPTVTFNRKEKLKKKGIMFAAYRLAWLVPAAAALILIFIGIRYFQHSEYENPTPIPTPVIASVVEDPGTPSQETPSVGTPSHGTPSQETPPQVSRPGSFRLKLARASTVTLPERDEETGIKVLAYDYSPVVTTEVKDRPIIGKAFGNLIAQVRNVFDNNTKSDKKDKSEFGFWSIAKAGVEGYNSISDRDLELFVSRNDEGKVTSYTLIEEDRLLLNRSLNKQ